MVAACARETRLVFLLEADTEGRDRERCDGEARRSKDSRGERRRIKRRGEKSGPCLDQKDKIYFFVNRLHGVLNIVKK